jgi:3-mercaptopyruvate sulfurtransferase SseA
MKSQPKQKHKKKIVVCSGRAVRNAVRTWKILEVLEVLEVAMLAGKIPWI